MTAPGRVGVVLLTMGEPENLDQVRPFLRQLLSDRDLVRLPIPALQPLFALAVSSLRAAGLRRRLAAIGGGSPLVRLTYQQRAQLKEALHGAGDFRVYAAMRYGQPSARDVVARMLADGVDRAVALPLYPQYCRATTGSSLHDLHRCLQEAEACIPVQELRSWPQHPGYLAALSDLVARSLAKAQGKRTHLLFSAHGVPQSFIDAGDPYLKEIQLTAEALRRLFPDTPSSLAFQSRTGRGRWLGPDTAEELVRLGRTGVEAAVVVPLSFVCDNSETLYDLDISMRAVAAEAGIKAFLRVPALNDAPGFIAALKDMVVCAQEAA
ncbi:MAG: ferrochelatase [Elusimicrobia bacterium]|nr:ferrochelatase [Elusimicrobiota bacterium]